MTTELTECLYPKFDEGLKFLANLLRLNARLLEEHTIDPCVQWILINISGRKWIIVERVYRAGIHMMPDPTFDDLELFNADPWAAWNKASEWERPN